MDNGKEIFPIVNEDGIVIGKVQRSVAHNGSKILHPVVHLHVFSPDGKIYLQKRPEWKDVQPGKWDTAVGGHVDFGEDIATAFKREINEELGISECESVFLGSYVFESDIERELVYVHKTVFSGTLNPNRNELSDGRFWSMDEIKANIGKGVFTPNFEHEYMMFFSK